MKFIIAPPTVSPDICVEQPPQGKASSFFTKAWNNGICYPHMWIPESPRDMQRNSTTGQYFQIRFWWRYPGYVLFQENIFQVTRLKAHICVSMVQNLTLLCRHLGNLVFHIHNPSSQRQSKTIFHLHCFDMIVVHQNHPKNNVFTTWIIKTEGKSTGDILYNSSHYIFIFT